MQEQVVRTYRGTQRQIAADFQCDARNMAQHGYQVVAQTAIPGKRGGCAGCLGMLTLGIGFLFIRPKDELVVTYRRF